MDGSIQVVDSAAVSAASGRREAAALTASHAQRIPLVYIQSATHSGSTLLALQLARHPEVCTVGELSGTRYRARPGYRCSCGEELPQCSFWQKVSAAMARRGFSYSATTAETDIRNAPSPWARRLLKPLHRGALLELVRDAGVLLCPGGRSHIRHHQQLKAALVESVVECTGKPVLVDSSKSGVQLKYHLRNARLDMKVIWLVRDGRGAALSLMRNARLAMHEAAYQWRRSNQEAAAIVRRLDRRQWMQVRYEALCAEPDRTLRRLWQFIGVAPDSPESSSAVQYHVLGHRMRLAGSGKIQLDEKWRTQLSADDSRAFETVAGPFNRLLGYR
jgi:hypothetical protein